MKPMRFQEAVKLLESNGFILIRSNGHIVYACGTVRIAIAHQRIVSVGVMRLIHKAIKQANELSMNQGQEMKAA